MTKATGIAEREAAEEMIVRHSPGSRRITLGVDTGTPAADILGDVRRHIERAHVGNERGRVVALVGAAA